MASGSYCFGMRPALIDENLTHSVIGAFYEVYNTLGFGFLENLYVMALERELLARGHRVSREFAVLIKYKDHELGYQRLDMVVNDRLVVETKSSMKLSPEAPRQLYNYLRATNLEVGLLLHFGPQGAKFYRQVCSNRRELSASSAQSAESG